MTMDRVVLAIAQHRQLIGRAARMIRAFDAGRELPRDAQFTEDELRQFDEMLADVWAERTGSTPRESGYTPPVAQTYAREYWKQLGTDGLAFVRVFRTCLEESQRRFETLQISGGTQVHVGDQYHVRADQIVSVGPNATVTGVTLNHDAGAFGAAEIRLLAEQLAELKVELRRNAQTLEQDEAVVEIGKAERAAAEGDTSKLMKHLGQAGNWAFDVATKIGVSVAAKALGSALGQSG